MSLVRPCSDMDIVEDNNTVVLWQSAVDSKDSVAGDNFVVVDDDVAVVTVADVAVTVAAVDIAADISPYIHDTGLVSTIHRRLSVLLASSFAS